MDANIGLKWNIATDEAGNSNSIIKVIGVGGGGVNAVNYMYECGIKGVKFAVCNTDAQSFQGINVPVKITLGSGLGAGGKPENARKELEKSIAEVEKLFDDGTQMVFIAAGMGGGTGSGAAPLIAKMAKDNGLLTVGIVTVPFLFERVPRIIQALDAVEEMSRNVDALIVINNERLKMYYPEFDLDEAFQKPNEVLSMAVKSIAEIITVKGTINRDFNDVSSTMKNGGVALVSYGFGAGENRLDQAIRDALDSPLLNNNDIYNAKRILFYISFKKDAHFKVDELTKYMDNFMERFDSHIDMIWGFGVDESLEDNQEVKFTIIATGFGLDAVPELKERNEQNRQKDLEQREKDEARVQSVYGANLHSSIHVNRVSQSSIIVLTMEEMDNDALITFMENNPVYKRNPKDVSQIRKPAKDAPKTGSPVAQEKNDDEQKAIVIEF